MKPSDKQVQWLWEQCGFKLKEDWKRKGYHYERTVKCPNWIYPDNPYWEYGESHLPRIDLNSLFKYAVPKLENRIGYKETFKLLTTWVARILEDNRFEDSADYLFELIYKALGGKEC